MKNEDKLLELASEKFDELTEVEKKLFKATANGEPADYSAKKDEDNDPAGAKNWDDSRTLKADRIAWLCTDKQASELVTHKGIQIEGARINGKLGLAFARIPFLLLFKRCNIKEEIFLHNAEITALNLRGTHTGKLFADGLIVKDGVFLCDGFKAVGEVRLLGAEIGGNFDCSSGYFFNPGGKALSADRLKVKGEVSFCDRFKSEGEVRLIGTDIGGSLDCSSGHFINPEGESLCADRLKVAGSVFLRDGFKSEGEVRLLGAEIGRNLDCSSGHFINPEGKSLNADGLKIAGYVFLRDGFKSEGEVHLLGAEIGRNLECSSGQFINPDGESLSADGLKVTGDVFLRDGFKSEGEVRLLGAEIGRNLECSSGQFINPDGESLSADGLKVAGDVFLREKFKSEGEVRFLGSEIGGSFECDSSQFVNTEPEGKSLNADGLKVAGNVFLRGGFEAHGVVDFIGAIINGYFQWLNVKSPSNATLDLRSARIGTLWDDKESWPDKGKIHLDGFVYNAIDEDAPLVPEARIDWLRRQPEGRFYPQPYEQLADVYKKSGRSEDAKKILIAKNEDPARLKQLTRWQKVWHHILRLSIGYGHRPSKALKWAIGIIFIGFLLFWWGDSCKLMAPTKSSAYVDTKVPGFDIKVPSDDYPKLSPFMYSIDMFVPLVNLHQAEYWMPNSNKGRTVIPFSWCGLTTGGLLRIWMWIQIIAGWVLSSLLIVGLSGLIKK